ncbi:lasso peptide biosynthesis B2 protein [Dyella lutea]|uniref:Lasso peptide biosynthesis B2 protein n=1 Tax=Dyella lutea TaxID=2950441 RepID=A0ABT1FBE2_9GAMM|nr:lasso peptide biosynthesis B2 protein [Dyella lutea]MCP1374691.1 lasso peptide biosynthesis B2 protein [Dyella lutea]
MSRYVLRSDLSYCQVGQRLVFLDIGSDRYFHLTPPMERGLTKYLTGDDCSEIDVRELVDRSILVEPPSSKASDQPSIAPADHSAMEVATPSRPLRILETIEVFAVVVATRIKLKTSMLGNLLDRLATTRTIRSARIASLNDISEQHILDAAAAFRRARLYVPIDMRCLLDSIAMANFLSRRGIAAHVVFGVALDPFSAHCWVQAGNLVLNDSLGNVASHTPIRVA